jgi:hypothetical protein
MAKDKMLCPFSGEMCRECPQFRGRHYYLCYYTKYRGYLGKAENKEKKKTWSRGDEKFEMPAPLKPSPKWLSFNDYIERKEK